MKTSVRTYLVLLFGLMAAIRLFEVATRNVFSRTRELKTKEHKNSRPIIYTTYEQKRGQDLVSSSDDLLRLWKEAWWDAGWDPVVLSIRTARLHPNYDFMLQELPPGLGYSSMQWLAMAHAGGGWLAQLNVFPLKSFTDEGYIDNLPLNGTLTVWENVVPSLVSGTAEEFARGALLLASYVGDEGKHSDILALIYLTRNSAQQDAKLINRREVLPSSKATSAYFNQSTVCETSKRAAHLPDDASFKTTFEWVKKWNVQCNNGHGKILSHREYLQARSAKLPTFDADATSLKHKSALVNQTEKVAKKNIHGQQHFKNQGHQVSLFQGRKAHTAESKPKKADEPKKTTSKKV